MRQIKEMLEKMGFEIVADEMKTTEWTENNRFFVVERDRVFHRIDYIVDSYGGEPSIVSVYTMPALFRRKGSLYGRSTSSSSRGGSECVLPRTTGILFDFNRSETRQESPPPTNTIFT